MTIIFQFDDEVTPSGLRKVTQKGSPCPGVSAEARAQRCKSSNRLDLSSIRQTASGVVTRRGEIAACSDHRAVISQMRARDVSDFQ
jgi:hypothetical protein